MKLILTLLALLASTAMAADITGTWKGKAETPNGTMERTFVLKVDGTTLTGETTSEFTGKSTINEGTVKGDDISFSITAKFQDREMKLNYKGKVSGDVMKLNVTGIEDGPTIEYVAKKVS